MNDTRIILQHFGDSPAQGRMARLGDYYVSAFALERTPPAALGEFGSAEAVFLLTVRDGMTGRMLAHAASGRASETLPHLLSRRGRPFFSDLVIFGGPDAARSLCAVSAALLRSGGTDFIETPSDESLRSGAPMPAVWRQLAGALGGHPAGLFSAAASASSRAYPDGMRFSCTERGAGGQGILTASGFIVEAGSCCSPADPTPSFTAPLRACVKTLARDGTLVKSGGVWRFTRDAVFPSALLAAAVLMRTAAGASAWAACEDAAP